MTTRATDDYGRTSLPSRRLLFIAIATTAVVALAGSAIVWSLFVRTYATPGGEVAADVPAQAGAPLHVGVARTPGGPSEWITIAKVLAGIQEATGRPVIVHYALSSEDQIAMFREGTLDLALMSTLAYLDVEDEGLGTIVASPMVQGRPLDSAVLVVAGDSPFTRLEDLEGKRLASSADLAGAAYMIWLLGQHGEDPKGFFGSAVTGVQDVNLTRVANGEADATTVRLSALANWPKGMFRIVETSPGLGMPPVVAHSSLDATTVAQVRDSLLKAADDGAIPAGSTITGFRVGHPGDYSYARLLDAIDRSLEKAAFGVAHQ